MPPEERLAELRFRTPPFAGGLFLDQVGGRGKSQSAVKIIAIVIKLGCNVDNFREIVFVLQCEVTPVIHGARAWIVEDRAKETGGISLLAGDETTLQREIVKGQRPERTLKSVIVSSVHDVGLGGTEFLEKQMFWAFAVVIR